MHWSHRRGSVATHRASKIQQFPAQWLNPRNWTYYVFVDVDALWNKVNKRVILLLWHMISMIMSSKNIPKLIKDDTTIYDYTSSWFWAAFHWRFTSGFRYLWVPVVQNTLHLPVLASYVPSKLRFASPQFSFWDLRKDTCTSLARRPVSWLRKSLFFLLLRHNHLRGKGANGSQHIWL